MTKRLKYKTLEDLPVHEEQGDYFSFTDYEGKGFIVPKMLASDMYKARDLLVWFLQYADIIDEQAFEAGKNHQKRLFRIVTGSEEMTVEEKAMGVKL